MSETSQRLDMALVARGLVASRSRARDMITRGLVTVAGHVVTKAGHVVAEAEAIELRASTAMDVSRGAEKLAAALDHFTLSPAGRTSLDVGASTGGFTQVLLERGAAKVYAVDVGHGQFHQSLATDPRVVLLERTDARALTAELIPDRPTAIVADVSFISLIKALPAPLALAAPGCWLVALIKPQFEAGRGRVGKGGIVKEAALRDEVVHTVSDWIASQPGWTVRGVIVSPIAGGSGNIEFLVGAVRGD